MCVYTGIIIALNSPLEALKGGGKKGTNYFTIAKYHPNDIIIIIIIIL